MQIMHPNDIIWVTGKYSTILIFLMQFILVVKYQIARKKMSNLETPRKILLGWKYVTSAAGC